MPGANRQIGGWAGQANKQTRKREIMAGIDYKAPGAREREHAPDVAYNTRMGVILFIVYVLFYGGFMALSAFWPELMGKPFLAGANLAVVYGFALILAAVVLALIYMKACRKSN